MALCANVRTEPDGCLLIGTNLKFEHRTPDLAR
jgi:hypothetical protein